MVNNKRYNTDNCMHEYDISSVFFKAGDHKASMHRRARKNIKKIEITCTKEYQNKTEIT